MRSLVGSLGDDLAYISDEYKTGVDTVSSGTLPTLCNACKRLQSAAARNVYLDWAARVPIRPRICCTSCSKFGGKNAVTRSRTATALYMPEYGYTVIDSGLFLDFFCQLDRTTCFVALCNDDHIRTFGRTLIRKKIEDVFYRCVVFGNRYEFRSAT